VAYDCQATSLCPSGYVCLYPPPDEGICLN
jgi:hypothetical protein